MKKSYKNRLLTLSTVLPVLVSLNSKADAQDLTASLSGAQLVLIARAAVIDEVTLFNSGLTDGTDLITDHG